MNILFMTAHPLLPQMVGGLQRSSAQLAEGLMARGHQVFFLGALMPDGWIGKRDRLLLKLTRKPAVKDHAGGLPTYRGWHPWDAVGHVCRKERIDLCVVLAMQPVKMAQQAQRHDIPVVMMLQDVEYHQHGGDFARLGPVPCVANSRFTADRFRKDFALDPIVIYPMVDGAKYRTETTRENVTFINPHPKKGLDVALNLARNCPDIPFAFVEGWPLTPEDKASLMERLAPLPNVTLHPTAQDMRDVYGKAKLVLAPSQWEEAFGRIGLEPQFSGIPVIATRIGGFPESVGEGGVLMDRTADSREWTAALRRLWDDDAFYEEKKAAALAHCAQPCFAISHQLDQWERVITQAAQGSLQAEKVNG